MCVRLRLVQSPRGAMICRFYRDISNDRNSHIRMCFQTKRNNRYANEEDGYYAHDLEMEMDRDVKKVNEKKARIDINFTKRTHLWMDDRRGRPLVPVGKQLL